MNISNIDKQALNGEWKFITDPNSEYSNEYVIDKIRSGEITGSMKIPQNWQLAGLYNYSGTVWFIKDFDAEVSDQDLKILKFHGVDYFTDVWLNNEYIGSHKGYFQSFYFNISSFLRRNNQLVVKVTSPKEDPVNVWPLKKKLIKGIFNHHDCRPGGWSPEHGQDQNTGGIWNDVELLHSKRIFLDHIKVTARTDHLNSKAIILAEIFYESNFENGIITELIYDVVTPSANRIKERIEAEIRPGKNKLLISFSLDNPELWWSWDTGEPNIYFLLVSGEYCNAKDVSFGIKEVKLDDNHQFFLNKKRLFLRGTNIIPEQFLSSLSKDRIFSMVSLMKAANINAVRIHAHVNRKEFLDECDRQGIIVWQDFALQWTYDESPEFIPDACSQIKDMVSMHYNHPSIAFWCCHNEPGEQINTLDRFLFDSVLSEDNTRIIRKASNYEEHPYDGWYWGKPEHFEAAPMGPLVTEFGAQGVPNKESLSKFISEDALYPPDLELWKYHNFQYIQTFLIAGVNKGTNIDEFIESSQEYQSYLIKTAIDSYRRKKNSGISAIFQFMFIDCWPSVTWSVIDYYGSKKKAYEALRIAYQPIYISVKMRQQKYLSQDKLNIEMWIINDTPHCYDKVSLGIFISDEPVWEFTNKRINADSIEKYDWEQFNIPIPQKFIAGTYNVNFIIRDENTKKNISCNQTRIEILNRE